VRKVIAALDNSAAAASVAATAKSLARTFGAAVECVHVGEDGDHNAAAIAAAAGLPFERLEGAVVPALARAARDRDAVALVVGARGLPSGRTVGSTALEVITSLTKPVVVVPPDAPCTATVKRVLVPLEGTSLTSTAPKGLIELADDANVDVVVLHVHDAEDVPSFTDQPQHEVDAWRDEFVARYCPWGIGQVTMQNCVGRREEEIVRVAGETNADLVAIGWAQRLAAGRAPIVRALLERGRTPVLLIPLRLSLGSRSRSRRSSWNSLQSSRA
jgi:nucleotide-binding universal stress UspA family protein